MMLNRGEMVRLRLINSGDSTYRMTLVGSPFKIIAMDAHDVNNPTSMEGIPFAIGSGQRFDLAFTMPEHGAVQLVNVDTSKKTSNIVKKLFFTPSAAAKNQALKATFGDEEVPAIDLATLSKRPLFDMNTYGSPVSEWTRICLR